MAKSLSMSFRNLKECQENLTKFGMQLDLESLKGILFEQIERIHKKALENVRMLYKRKTGNLEESLIARPGSSKTRATAWLKASYKIANHAHLLEFGHRIVTHSGKDTGKVVYGHSFFRPAVDMLKTSIRYEIRNKLSLLLQGKGARKPKGMFEG
jgi:hypothetical protein